jgi:acetylornithine deacetylase/succinyl-diaminopimelate desuccinylase-like protein
MFDSAKAIADFIRFPSISADPSAREGMQGAIDFLVRLLREAAGCDSVEVAPTAGHPCVIGKRGGDPAWPHLVIYGHYDVQPPDPLGEWESAPFDPVIRNGLMYGRGVADDKGPLMVHIAALANILARRPDLPLRVTFIVEGEEEIGSPNLAALMEERRAELRGDMVLMSDTGCMGIDDAAITTGLRGLCCLEVKLQALAQDVHSGFHGGPVMNPIRALAALCATLHDEEGRVNIPGFYDDVSAPQQWERDELLRLGWTDEFYKNMLGVKELFPLPGYTAFEARCMAPTLEYNGISGGYQGPGSKTIIPARASAKISCRLVPDQKADKMLELVEKTLYERCPKGVTMTIERQHGGDPYISLPPHKSGEAGGTVKAAAFAEADAAIREVFGSAPTTCARAAACRSSPTSAASSAWTR